MRQSLCALQERLAPAEEIFFTWLTRVFAVAVLVGSAWIDDAPPLELGAWVLALYVAARVVSQLPALFSAAPFENRGLKAFFALACLMLFGLSFLVVAIAVEHAAVSVAG